MHIEEAIIEVGQLPKDKVLRDLYFREFEARAMVRFHSGNIASNAQVVVLIREVGDWIEQVGIRAGREYTGLHNLRKVAERRLVSKLRDKGRRANKEARKVRAITFKFKNREAKK